MERSVSRHRRFCPRPSGLGGAHRSFAGVRRVRLRSFHLLIPAWGALGRDRARLIGAADISFWPVWIAGAVGAALGDWLSYWFGFKYKEHVAQMWAAVAPIPICCRAAKPFVKRWGRAQHFHRAGSLGHLRASVPLAAGIFEMPYWRFQVANFVSALVWAAAAAVVRPT